MSKTTIALILAAGEAQRMDGKEKQLLTIGGTTILSRILTQLEERDVRSIVVTHNSLIAGYHHRIHNPSNRDTVCDSLLSTNHLWDDRTIVLLGDVVYSSAVMDNVVGCHDPIRVFGTTWEIFSIVFDKKMKAKVMTALRRGRKHGLGKLRYFYRSYCGFDLDCKEEEAKPMEHNVFFYTRDWTRDIDSPYEYERLMIEIVNTGMIND